MMGLLKSKKLLLTTACVLALGLSDNAQAQTANMTADVTVLNTLTIATPAQLNFGTVAAVRDAANTATATIDTAGALTTASGGGTAVMAAITGTPTAAQVTIADGADGATLNITIDNVVDPVNGAESFVLDQFVTSYNGGADVAQTIAATFTETFDSAFGGGTNTLDIGATITTTLGATAYADGGYAGTYDVIISY